MPRTLSRGMVTSGVRERCAIDSAGWGGSFFGVGFGRGFLGGSSLEGSANFLELTLSFRAVLAAIV